MIYLLHSTTPLKRVSGPVVKHYLGWCRDGYLVERLLEHRSGHSAAKIIRAFLAAGGQLVLVATWPGASKNDERRLKRLGHLDRFCPVCTPTVEAPAVWSMPRRYRPRAF